MFYLSSDHNTFCHMVWGDCMYDCRFYLDFIFISGVCRFFICTVYIIKTFIIIKKWSNTLHIQYKYSVIAKWPFKKNHSRLMCCFTLRSRQGPLTWGSIYQRWWIYSRNKNYWTPRSSLLVNHWVPSAVVPYGENTGMFHKFREEWKNLIASTTPFWLSARTGDVFEFEITQSRMYSHCESLKLSCNLLFSSLVLS